MIFTAEMVHLTAVVLRSKADAVSQALLRSGAVHLDRLRDVSPSLGAELHDTSLDTQRRTLTEARQRIESVLAMGGTSLPALSSADTSGKTDLDALNGKLDRIIGEIEQLRRRQGDIQQEINRVEEVQRVLDARSSTGGAGRIVSESLRERHRYLDVRYGLIPADQVEHVDHEITRLSGLLVPMAADASGETAVVVVAMKRNEQEVSRLLDECGFRKQEPPSGPTVGPAATDGAVAERAEEQALSRLRELRGEQAEQEAKIGALVGTRRDELVHDWRSVRAAELLTSIRTTTSESEHAAVFSGWVPARMKRRLSADVRTAAGDACVLEWHTAEEMSDTPVGASTPVELRNPRFLRPFQMLVTNYGTPAYRTVDPTPLVAVAYLAMFGLMFGDAGHGLVLVLLGIVGRRIMKSGSMRQLSSLLTWCGGASVLTGVLFGSYFGFDLLPPLWFDYHGVVAGHAAEGPIRNLMDILSLTVYLGIAVIGAGILLNWVNRIRTRQWTALIFDKAGILGGIIYAAGVWAAIRFAHSGFRQLPDMTIVATLIGIPSLLLFLKFPLEARMHRNSGDSKQHGGSPAMWVMDWVIELLEVFSGYLANTLSFMRVAGLGIAHVMLMVAFFQIAKMITPDGYSLMSIAALVFGNVLVIGLEGLSAGIQSLRLNYYEFFSKHFVPTGTAYRPVSLGSS